MPRTTNRLIAYFRTRSARAMLLAMDDRMLADIGLGRCEIERAISGRLPR